MEYIFKFFTHIKQKLISKMPSRTGSFLSKIPIFLIFSFLCISCRPMGSVPLFYTLEPVSRFDPAIFENKGLLAKKAVLFEKEMQETFLSPEGIVLYKRNKIEAAKHINLHDSAIWTGCYLASLAFRYAVTKDQDAYDAMARVSNGLYMLAKVSGKKGLLARTLRKGEALKEEKGEWHQGTGEYANYRWMSDVSTDQLDGFIFGYSVALPYLKGEDKRKGEEAVTEILSHIYENNLKMIDIDGNMTKHGDLGGSFIAEPLDRVILLAGATLAKDVSDDKAIQNGFNDLIKNKKFHKKITDVRGKWWEYFSGIHHSDNNLAFLAYNSLLLLENDPQLTAYYKKGLIDTFNAVKTEKNPFFNFSYLGNIEEENKVKNRIISSSIETLILFPEHKISRTTSNHDDDTICKSWFRDRHEHAQSCWVVPIDKRPLDAFYWKANPYRLDENEKALKYAGVDYLLPYWMGRYYGFITEKM